MEPNANPFFKNRIVTTGPTPVPEFVLNAMSGSVYYHRGPAFAAIMKECRELLPKMFGTNQEALIFNGTGTLAMEGAIANFFNAGDKVLAINGGKFGERWAQQARVYGLNVLEIKTERGVAVDNGLVQKHCDENPDLRGILIHLSETSTGVRHDVKTVAQMAQKMKDCLTLVDAVTAVGVFEIPMDRWGLDVVVGGSQKGMMMPPGLSFGVASAKAWQRSEGVKSIRYYLDWRKEKKAALENTGAFTSAVTLVGGLREVLRYFESTGHKNIFQRNWKMTFATREAAKAMGFGLLVKNDAHVSAACTSVLVDGAYPGKIRDRYSMTISGGQDDLKGKIVRVGHMGYLDAWDVLNQMMAIQRVAQIDFKQKLNLTAGIEAFWNVVESNQDFTPSDLKN